MDKHQFHHSGWTKKKILFFHLPIAIGGPLRVKREIIVAPGEAQCNSISDQMTTQGSNNYGPLAKTK